jgi:hypothetical protein
VFALDLAAPRKHHQADERNRVEVGQQEEDSGTLIKIQTLYSTGIFKHFVPKKHVK